MTVSVYLNKLISKVRHLKRNLRFSQYLLHHSTSYTILYYWYSNKLKIPSENIAGDNFVTLLNLSTPFIWQSSTLYHSPEANVKYSWNMLAEQIILFEMNSYRMQIYSLSIFKVSLCTFIFVLIELASASPVITLTRCSLCRSCVTHWHWLGQRVVD